MTWLNTVILLALAGPDPAAILEKVDAAANRAHDTVLTLHISVSTRGSAPLERRLKVWQQGAERRMVKFVSPARLRGTGILVPERGTTKLYMPAYRRVRRVAGKEGGGSFMGTGFSINDLARVRFSGDYTPTFESETPEHVVLLLKPIKPDAHRHAMLRLEVRKKDHLAVRISALDGAGKATRVIEATDFRAIGNYTIAHRIRISEPAENKETVATIEAVAFDTGLEAGYFTERNLMRGP